MVASTAAHVRIMLLDRHASSMVNTNRLNSAKYCLARSAGMEPSSISAFT